MISLDQAKGVGDRAGYPEEIHRPDGQAHELELHEAHPEIRAAGRHRRACSPTRTRKPGPDGKPIYEGTTDILDDADCGYTMWVSSEPVRAERIVEFENRKSRGDVRQRAAFAYSGADGLSYEQLLASVRQVDDAEAGELQVAATIRADDAPDRRRQRPASARASSSAWTLIAAIAQRSKCGRRKAQDLLDKYTGVDLLQHHWTYDVQARGAKVYRLLEPPPDADASATPATGPTDGDGP